MTEVGFWYPDERVIQLWLLRCFDHKEICVDDLVGENVLDALMQQGKGALYVWEVGVSFL